MKMKEIKILLLLISVQLLQGQNCTGPGHSTNEADNWSSCIESQNPNSSRVDSHWVLYDLGYTYNLGNSHFWNYNVTGETDKGIQELTIDYSSDGQNWTELGMMSLLEATGASDYEGEAGIDFGGVGCRYVLITSTATWGASCAGLSEVRFDITSTDINLRDVYIDDITIELYPNPTEGFFTIEGNLSYYNIAILDAAGAIYMTLTGQSSPITIDISALPAGLYFVSLSHISNSNLCLQKILKQ